MVGFQTNGDDTQQSRKDWKQHMHAARREGCLRARPLRELCFDRRPPARVQTPSHPSLIKFSRTEKGGAEGVALAKRVKLQKSSELKESCAFAKCCSHGFVESLSKKSH